MRTGEKQNVPTTGQAPAFLEDLSQTELKLPNRAGDLSEHLPGEGCLSMLTHLAEFCSLQAVVLPLRLTVGLMAVRTQ